MGRLCVKGIIQIMRSDITINGEDAEIEVDVDDCTTSDWSLFFVHPTARNVQFNNLRIKVRIQNPENTTRTFSLGVLRVSRKRLARYYVKNENVNSLLNEEIGCMDKIYFDVHLRRLKEFKKEEVNKIKAYSELYQKIVYILEIEKKIAEVLNDGQRRH